MADPYPPPQVDPYPPPQADPYPPPQAQPPPYIQPVPPAATVVVAQQPIAAPNPVFRDKPVTLPDGNITQLRYKIGILTWIIVGVTCLTTMWFGVCCLAIIPFFINDLKDVEHVHPVTGQVVGIYKRV